MYWKILIASYIATFVVVSFWAANKQAGMIRALQRNGISEAELDAFRKEMFPRTILMLVWSTFFIGSLLGGAISGVAALID